LDKNHSDNYAITLGISDIKKLLKKTKKNSSKTASFQFKVGKITAHG